MGTRKNRLGDAVLTSTQNLCFEQKYEKYQIFLSENFIFLEVKFSLYLNRRVFVMVCIDLSVPRLRVNMVFFASFVTSLVAELVASTVFYDAGIDFGVVQWACEG